MAEVVYFTDLARDVRAGSFLASPPQKPSRLIRIDRPFLPGRIPCAFHCIQTRTRMVVREGSRREGRQARGNELTTNKKNWEGTNGTGKATKQNDGKAKPEGKEEETHEACVYLISNCAVTVKLLALWI